MVNLVHRQDWNKGTGCDENIWVTADSAKGSEDVLYLSWKSFPKSSRRPVTLPKITSIDFFPPRLHFKIFPCSTYSTAWMCTSRFLGKSVHPGMKTGRRRLLQSERRSGRTGNFSSVRPLLMWVKTKWLSLSSFIECYQKLSQRWQAVIYICSPNRQRRHQECTMAWWGNCKRWSSVT